MNTQVRYAPLPLLLLVVGGESVVRVVDGEITVGPERVGPSVALGGTEPTLGVLSSY